MDGTNHHTYKCYNEKVTSALMTKVVSSGSILLRQAFGTHEPSCRWKTTKTASVNFIGDPSNSCACSSYACSQPLCPSVALSKLTIIRFLDEMLCLYILTRKAKKRKKRYPFFVCIFRINCSKVWFRNYVNIINSKEKNSANNVHK